jgi:hypothetical protein
VRSFRRTQLSMIQPADRMRPRARASKCARWSSGRRACSRPEFLKAVSADRALAVSKHGPFSARDLVKREVRRKSAESAGLAHYEQQASGSQRERR